MYDGENVFMDWAKVVDCGDAPLTWLDNTFALKQLGEAHKVCVTSALVFSRTSFASLEEC